MTAVIRFSKELGEWIAEGLEHGWPRTTLILALIDERLDAGIARALVEAFARARSSGEPFPKGELTVQKASLGEGVETWHGSDGHASWKMAVTMIAND